MVHHHCISPENMLCSDKDGTRISFFGTTEMLFVFFSCSLNLELGFDFVSSVVAYTF
jgi:hypothetical protein